MNETTIPVLPCFAADELLAFYEALGFEVTYRQMRPYLYLALRYSGFELHFGDAPKALDPKDEMSGGCLVMVDDVASYHQAFSTAMRKAYGKVLASSLPRITRFRKGQSRFSLIDPSGNTLIFIQRDEPAELEYGGSKGLTGLARQLDNARIFREFKTDDEGAAKILDVALRRYGAEAPALEVARALLARAELADAMGDLERVEACQKELDMLPLTEAERLTLEEGLS